MEMKKICKISLHGETVQVFLGGNPDTPEGSHFYWAATTHGIFIADSSTAPDADWRDAGSAIEKMRYGCIRAERMLGELGKDFPGDPIVSNAGLLRPYLREAVNG